MMYLPVVISTGIAAATSRLGIDFFISGFSLEPVRKQLCYIVAKIARFGILKLIRHSYLVSKL